ncbi:MAG: DUF1957 domain-containing protein [Planctomycetes bacterium]|nr:DUF1957 domain-containing protein [Planctomycetota bacterium]
MNGYLSLILHAHLPYVRHPEYPDFMEEDWLFEAITEVYLPLFDVFERLHNENISFRLTINLSPTLCEMLTDDLLKERYTNHLNRLVELAEKETIRTKDTPFNNTALMYRNRFYRVRDLYNNCQRNIVCAFRKLQDAGRLEIITCGATHGFLPLMATPQAVRGQVQTAVNNYKKHFGRPPRGIWLPECAYKPGDEIELKKAGLQFFIIDSHGIEYAQPAPAAGVYLPMVVNGVAAFGRDPESSRQVWSAKEGYPGDMDYREFYRDLGYDADYNYIKPYLHSDGVRRNVGIKYQRITGQVPLHLKEPYNYHNALNKVDSHAGNFMFNRQQQIRYILGQSAIHNSQFAMPIVVAPYDAELFGHWWFEGPEFLYALIKKIATQQSEIGLITPSEYLSKHQSQIGQPTLSSWGDKGYAEVWLNGKNDWIYRHLHKAEERMIELARSYQGSGGAERSPDERRGGTVKDALNQAARELLLAQSSDWPFLMTTGHSISYAQKRLKTHLTRFNQLYDQIKNNRVNEEHLNRITAEDNIFSEIDYKVYQ